MPPLRVLWFTGVPLPALTGQGLTRAGWQEGLRRALEMHQPDLELGIAAFGSEERAPLTRGNATYYTIPRLSPRGPLRRALSAWQHASFSPVDYHICLEFARRFEPDLVHFHGSENPFGLISRELAAPSVLSIQAIVNGYFPFYFSDVELRDILKFLATKKFAKGEGFLHKWMNWKEYLPVEQDILRTCRNFMGRTDWDRAVLLSLAPQANYYHCDEVLNEVFYSRSWNPESASEAVIYTTTSDAFSKGSLTLAKAVVILKQRGWQKVQLRIAGISSSTYVGSAVARLAREKQLHENIIWLSKIPPEQVCQEILHASVYVHPSHIDNSPNSLCEAMLAGAPCIAAHAGGVPSLVTEGVDGMLYHDQDEYILAEKIARILSDRAAAVRLGAQARKTALVRHDPKTIARRTVEIYRQIIRSHSSKGGA